MVIRNLRGNPAFRRGRNRTPAEQGRNRRFAAKRAKYPTFKSKKKSRLSAEHTRSAFRWRDGELTLAKIDGPLPPAAQNVGVDAGITAPATLSTGEKVVNPRHERRDRRKPAKAQRALARKEKGSNNRAKAKPKVAKVYARIADRRTDHLHKVTTRLVRENQVIAVEDLAVRSLVGNHSLARAISDAAWRRMRSMLEYKAAWYGRTLVAVDRWLPSSRLCPACGALREKMPLNVRMRECACGTVHDRDVNAARDVLAAGPAAN